MHCFHTCSSSLSHSFVNFLFLPYLILSKILLIKLHWVHFHLLSATVCPYSHKISCFFAVHLMGKFQISHQNLLFNFLFYSSSSSFSSTPCNSLCVFLFHFLLTSILFFFCALLSVFLGVIQSLLHSLSEHSILDPWVGVGDTKTICQLLAHVCYHVLHVLIFSIIHCNQIFF